MILILALSPKQGQGLPQVLRAVLRIWLTSKVPIVPTPRALGTACITGGGGRSGAALGVIGGQEGAFEEDRS